MSKDTHEQQQLESDFEKLNEEVDDFTKRWGAIEAFNAMSSIMIDVCKLANKCVDCHEELSDPVRENREGGNFEMVTYCKCGATYTN